MLFNHFSFSDADVPSVPKLKEDIRRFKETSYIWESGWQDDRDITYLGNFQPRWLKRLANKIRQEFPGGGVPVSHGIYAVLLEIPAGAEKQKLHKDSENPTPFWSIFVPLTRHKAQGTTAFHGGIYPSHKCRNYAFSSDTLHYGQANRSPHTRCVLVFMVGPAELFDENMIPVA
jgi:hypothetical protein